MRGAKWSREEREEHKLPNMDPLPVHLRSLDFGISTHGSRKWGSQGNIVIPGSSVVQLYAGQGELYVGHAGWPNPVDVTGRFNTGAIMGPADGGFTRPGWNKFCMVVGTPKVAFHNNTIPNWGASGKVIPAPDSYWIVGANDGGKCMVAFNDNDDRDNHGTLAMVIRITQQSDFVLLYEHLALF